MFVHVLPINFRLFIVLMQTFYTLIFYTVGDIQINSPDPGGPGLKIAHKVIPIPHIDLCFMPKCCAQTTH